MLRKLARKFYEMTHKYEKKPFMMTDVDYKTILDFNNQVSYSETAHYLVRLQEVIDNPRTKLEKWEMEQIDQFIKDYTSRFKSPLTKALE